MPNLRELSRHLCRPSHHKFRAFADSEDPLRVTEDSRNLGLIVRDRSASWLLRLTGIGDGGTSTVKV